MSQSNCLTTPTYRSAHLANFVRISSSDDVGYDRSRADDSNANVVLKHFRSEAVEVALTIIQHQLVTSASMSILRSTLHFV